MSKLKNRIEVLQQMTASTAVLEACNIAISRIETNAAFTISGSEISILENEILSNLLESLTKIDDESAKQFISMSVIEKRTESLNNLGVKKTISVLAETEIANHPAFAYVFEKIKASSNSPEWLIIESVISALSPFNWDSTINECLKGLVVNADKFREEIAIYKIVENLKTSRSSYLLTGVSSLLEAYLDNRTASDRVRLMEKTSQFLFDPNMKNLYNFLGESSRLFHVSVNDNSCIANRVYSPVFLGEGFELFSVANKIYKKTASTISVANEEEISMLPSNFIEVTKVLGKENVVIAEGVVKIYSGDKKIEIFESEIKINEKVVNAKDIHTVYLNSGVFKISEKENINHIHTIKENWGSICEMDFAKLITSKSETHKKMSIFIVDESIFINKDNSLMNESVFYADCNAMQTKNLVMEYMKFDVSSAIELPLNEESKAIKQSNELKSELVSSINHLNTQKIKLEDISKVTESDEIKELVIAIDEEIEFLKSEYSKIDSVERSVTKVSEGTGFNVGDTASLEKKKVSVTASETADNTVTVIDKKGASSKVQSSQLKPIDKKHRSVPGNPTEINSQSDGNSVAIKEDKEEGYVYAKISVEVQGVPAGTSVQVKALDYTSKADEEDIDVILPNKKLAQIKKKDVKLFEAGVYNSETDIKNNPKTKENKPDDLTGSLDTVLDGVENLIAEITNLKTSIDSDTKFSSDTLEKCITELNLYKTSLSEEKNLSKQSTLEA